MGEETKTTLCICYVEGVVEPRVLQRLRRRLSKVKIDGVLDSNYVQEFIRDSPRSPFKTVGGTEKPDVVASCLLEGRAAVLVDGSPVVLTIPISSWNSSNQGRITMWAGILPPSPG